MIFSALLLAWGLAANPWPDAPWAVFAAAYLPVALPVLVGAGRAVREGELFSEFTLMIIATVGAWAIGEYAEAVAVMLFYCVGEHLQEKAEGRARNDIRALAALRPDKARVVQASGNVITCSPDEVRVGQTVEVPAGARVPIDGVLLTPTAYFDTSALTGEAAPRAFSMGEEISAGLIATGQAVRIETIRAAGESATARIMQMVEDATRHKAPAEKFIRRFARVYTPIVIALAALIAVLPPLAGLGAWSDWGYRALVFLVISCPCALVVSVPLCYFRGIGTASGRGILFKGGDHLAAAASIKAVAFDKTGTLTQGRFSVKNVSAAATFSPEKIISLAAALERASTHPIAAAIVQEANAEAMKQAADVKEIAGMGLAGNVDGEEIIAGNAALFHHKGVILPPEAATDPACTYVHLACGGRYAGSLALHDAPKPQAREAVERLRDMGIQHVALLSGDSPAVAQAVGNETACNEAFGELSPAEKVSLIKEIKERVGGAKVAFVGDGINDAPALAVADVGFAIGGTGSDAAVETAGAMLQNGNPLLVAEAIALARLTRRVATFNIGLALGVKVLVLLLGALGLAGLWAAVVADTGVALVCVANTYFIRKK